MGVRIFCSIGSRASRCLCVAEETGIAFACQPISTLDGSNRSPEFFAINPSRKIPAMKDGDLFSKDATAVAL